MSIFRNKPGQLVSSLAIVEKTWGADVPNWIVTLARECDKSSQSAVAKQIDRSAALVNQVLKNTYGADLKAIQRRVETVFGCAIQCPVLGLIDGQRCLKEQSQPYRPGNHVTVSLFRACKKCPRRLENAEAANAQ